MRGSQSNCVFAILLVAQLYRLKLMDGVQAQTICDSRQCRLAQGSSQSKFFTVSANKLKNREYPIVFTRRHRSGHCQ